MDTLDEIRSADYIERHPESNAALAVREAAHAYSFGVFLAEFERGSSQILETPQWPRRTRSTVAEVFEMLYDAEAVLGLIRAATKSTDIAVRLQAQAIVAALARQYADDVAESAE